MINNCWLYAGSINSNGYGLVFSQGKRYYAHTAMYENEVKPVPKGLQIDHLCRIRRCINPRHLEPVTHKENTLRGNGITAINARRTHCINGHEFTKENTYNRKSGGRYCRQCGRDFMKKKYMQLYTPV